MTNLHEFNMSKMSSIKPMKFITWQKCLSKSKKHFKTEDGYLIKVGDFLKCPSFQQVSKMTTFSMLKDEEKGGLKNMLSAPFKEKALQNAALVRFGATTCAPS